MHNNLRFFESFLEKENVPIIAAQPNSHSTLIDFLFEKEVIRLREQIYKSILRTNREEEIRDIIQYYQRNLLSISFRFLELDEVHSINEEKSLYYLAFQSIESLLQFLEKDYFEHLDINLFIPFQSTLILEKNVHKCNEHLDTALNKIYKHEQNIDFLYEPFHLIVSVTLIKRISYQQLLFCLSYIDIWEKYINKKNIQFDCEEVVKVLITSNHNSIDSFDFITDFIINEINESDVIEVKIDILRLFLKEYKQLQCSYYCFDKNLPALNIQIVGFLEEEINYWLSKPHTNSESLPSNKISTTFSVAELGLFVRLQFESGILKTSSQKQLLKFVAQSYQTENTSEISSNSLLTKYYNIESGSKKEVKIKLKQMIDLLNEW